MQLIRLPSSILTAFAAAILSIPCQTHADTIIDTGPGISVLGWTSGYALENTSFYQNMAIEFTLTNSANITSVEGWIHEAIWSTGSLTVGIGTTPGEMLYSGTYQSQELSGINQWTGLTGLNWSLQAGTYWVSFIAEAGFSGTMLGGAPLPLPRLAISHTYNPPWNIYNYYGLETDAFGIRILGNPQGVPDSGITIILLGGALVGLTGLRRRFVR